MKKIVGGKMYDTATATLLGQWDNGRNPNEDFHWREEALYRNAHDAYFLYAKGGALSPHRGSWAGNHTKGEKIIPMSVEEAQIWAEEHLSTEEYDALFGLPKEAPPDLSGRERVHMSLDAALMAGLRRMSREMDVPVSRLVDRAVRAMYAEQFVSGGKEKATTK